MARQIVVDIVGDSTKFQKATQEATQSGGKFGGLIQGVAMGAGLGVFNAAMDAGRAAIGWFGDSLTKGSDQIEALGKMTVIFGDQAGAIEKWAGTAATSMGMSKTAALGAVGTFGNLFTAMKLAPGPSQEMSQNLVQLAGDLASFNNLDPTEVLEKLRAGVTGESEPLKTLGININEATLKTKAMELGLYDGKGALDAGAKAQAAYALMLEQSSAAQGDFARTSDGAANKGRIMDAKMENLQATIGKKLQPVFLAVLDAGMKFVDILLNIVDAVSPVISQIGEKLTPVFVNVGRVVKNDIAPVLTSIAKVVLPVLYGAFKVAASIIGTEVGIIVNVIKGIFTAVGWVVDHLRGPISVISNLFRGVASVVKSVFGGVSGIVKGAINSVIRVINAIIRGINSIQVHIHVGPVGYDFWGLRIGQLGYIMHSGGIVPGTPGSDVPTILQAGERVIPRSQAGGGNVTINIESFVGSDHDIDAFADRVAYRLRLAGA